MRTDLEVCEGLCIVRMKGRFVTGSEADYVRARGELERMEVRAVLADCREVPYLDSTGLNFVVGLYAAVCDVAGRFALVGPNRRVREVLRICGLDRIIPMFEEEETALSALKRGARAAGAWERSVA